MTKTLVRAAICLAAVSLGAGSAFAGSVTFTLTRASLINVTDAAGTSQQEAGTVAKGGSVVGNYFITRRVNTLASALFNTGATHITLFFAPKRGTTAAPDNVTIDGAHDFTSGAFKGSVSATSPAYSWVRDGDATYTISSAVETLVLNWTGANQITLP